MDEIEHKVALPKGAMPLASYGRGYAFSSGGKVVATYLVPFPPIEMGKNCEVMLENLNSRPCTTQEIAEDLT